MNTVATLPDVFQVSTWDATTSYAAPFAVGFLTLYPPSDVFGSDFGVVIVNDPAPLAPEATQETAAPLPRKPASIAPNALAGLDAYDPASDPIGFPQGIPGATQPTGTPPRRMNGLAGLNGPRPLSFYGSSTPHPVWLSELRHILDVRFGQGRGGLAPESHVQYHWDTIRTPDEAAEMIGEELEWPYIPGFEGWTPESPEEREAAERAAQEDEDREEDGAAGDDRDALDRLTADQLIDLFTEVHAGLPADPRGLNWCPEDLAEVHPGVARRLAKINEKLFAVL